MLIRSIGLLLAASLNWVVTVAPAAPPVALPITGGAPVAVEQSAAAIPTLDNFAATVKSGQPGQVVGVYVPKVLALRVAQQPANNPAYVTRTRDYATQFSLAAKYGTTALLAHNYLSGALFFNLSAGQEVDIIYGDGAIRRYRISTLRHFQALSPADLYSDFVDLDNGGAQLSTPDLFYQIYAGGDRVVFQTCIKAQGNASWGRLFVIATPI